MKRLYFLILLALVVNPGIDAQKSFLNVLDSFNTSLPVEGYFGDFDVYNDLLYGIIGDTIISINLENGEIQEKFGLPDEEYAGFNSFLKLNADASQIWVGFTKSDNSDDRIYSINSTNGEWEHIATMPANFDLAFYKDKVFVSGLNSTDWSAPNGIWNMDLSGENEHALVIATGGYSAGLDIDSNGNVYYGTNIFGANNLLKWNEADIEASLADTEDTLKVADAITLTSIPAGVYDVELDEAGNLAFNCNNFVLNFLGVWDGDDRYDTIATTEAFMTYISTRGNIRSREKGNHVFASAYGTEIAETHYDLVPEVIDPLADLEFVFGEYEESDSDLNLVFTDEDDHDSIFVYTVLENTNESLVSASISKDVLTIEVIGEEPGNAEVTIQAASNLHKVTDAISLTVSNPVGFETTVTEESILVYPNPGYDNVKIAANNLENGHVSIYDMSGRVVLNRSYLNSGDAINISTLKPGNYVLVLQTAQHSYHTQIVKR